MANGIVYVGADYPDGTLYALDAGTGALGVQRLPSVKESTLLPRRWPTAIVYFGGEGSYLYAFNALTGAVVWKSAKSEP